MNQTPTSANIINIRPTGFTMTEMVVSLSVISVCFITVMMVIRSTTDNIGFELTVNDQQVITRSAMDKMMEELRLIPDNVSFSSYAPHSTDSSQVNETATTSSTSRFLMDAGASNESQQYGVSQFPISASFNPGPRSLSFGIPNFNEANGTLDLGAPDRCVTYRWMPNRNEIPSNDIDDNGNGFVDEGRIERIRRYINSSGDVKEDLQVICDHVPQGGFLLEKSGRRLKITIARKNNTPRRTQDGTKFTTTITHVTYFLKNRI